MSDFESYDLADISRNPNRLYELSDGLVPEMAQALGFELSETPDVDNLKAFIGYISPEKTLQDNVALTRERLAKISDVDAVTTTANWVERSGSLNVISRSFVYPAGDLTRIGFGAAIFNTGVARWQERRAKELIALKERGVRFGEVIIFAGNRKMGETEHSEVEAIAKRTGELPTESDFASSYIKDMLTAKDIKTDVVAVDSSNADEIIREGILRKGYLYDLAILAIGNAPSTIQVAAQYRKAARSIEVDEGFRFDEVGNQLYMAGDSIPVARHGENPATHQNPISALGQIARNALMLYEQSKTLN